MAAVFARSLRLPEAGSFLLVGPRGTGKSHAVAQAFPDARVFDLEDPHTYATLVTKPLASLTGPLNVIDGLDRLPALVGAIAALEAEGARFVLLASSVRDLEVRWPVVPMHPLTAVELGASFDLMRSLERGHLPAAQTAERIEDFFRSYQGMLLRDVSTAGLTRNLEAFARVLRAASHHQARVLSISALSREVDLSRKTVEGHLALLEALGIVRSLPVFAPRTRRPLITHPKFFYFDVGLYRSLSEHSLLGTVGAHHEPALESLVHQELRATNDRHGLGYALSYWHTRDHLEVDFVLEGERDLLAFEVRASERVSEDALIGLRAFAADHPNARCHLLYGGTRHLQLGRIEIWPIADALHALPAILGV